MFGRGGEEMLYLQQRGIRVHCIPGVVALPVLRQLKLSISHLTSMLVLPTNYKFEHTIDPLTHIIMCICTVIRAASGICSDVHVLPLHWGLGIAKLPASSPLLTTPPPARTGITAASGICADIGVPLTHRGLATSVKFLTGHSRDGGKEQLDESIDSGGSSDVHLNIVIN